MKKYFHFKLSNTESLLSFSGEDALTFLQGQITCDINQLNGKNSLFGAFCSPKGRVISLFHVFKRADTCYMCVPKDLTDVLIKRLKMFIFRSKVTIKDVSDDFVIVGHTSSEEKIESEYLAHLEISSQLQPSISIFTQKVFSQLSDDVANSISDHTHLWDLETIKAGIPSITSKTMELFVPQMLNLELLDGISFTKGCYTGQEIIARMHYKGKLKRRMYIFKSPTAIESGIDIFNKTDESSIGTIVNCESNESGNHIGTVVLKIASINSPNLELNNDTVLTIQSPPYDFNTEA